MKAQHAGGRSRIADAALYEVKRNGRNGLAMALGDPGMGKPVKAKAPSRSAHKLEPAGH